MTPLETNWLAAGTQAERAKLIKKYSLLPGVSKVRPGEVKLGIANELKGSPKKEIPALDNDGELIMISGFPPKIRYPMKAVVLPEKTVTPPEETATVKCNKPLEDGTDVEPKVESTVKEGLFGFGNKPISRGDYVSAKDDTKGTVIFVINDRVTYIDANGNKYVKDSNELKNLGRAGSIKESLSPSDPIDVWIKDFVNSDDIRFKGKTKEERIEMAKGAYYGAQKKEALEDGTDDARDVYCKNTPGQTVTEDVESEYTAATSDSAKKAVLKKYSVMPGVSKLRPGEVKLGISNELNGKKTIYATDADEKLIAITGTKASPKIRYVADSFSDFRLDAILEKVTGCSSVLLRKAFLSKNRSLVESVSTVSIRDSFKKFVKESSETYEVTLDVGSVNLKDAGTGAKLVKTSGSKQTWQGEYDRIVDLLNVFDDGANDFTRNGDDEGIMKFYSAKKI